MVCCASSRDCDAPNAEVAVVSTAPIGCSKGHGDGEDDDRLAVDTKAVDDENADADAEEKNEDADDEAPTVAEDESAETAAAEAAEATEAASRSMAAICLRSARSRTRACAASNRDTSRRLAVPPELPVALALSLPANAGPHSSRLFDGDR